MKRRSLTQEEQADAVRLKQHWLAYKAKTGSTQDELAEMCGWANQSAVSQYLRGTIPLNLSALIKFSKAFGVSPESISPSLAEQLQASLVTTDVPKSQNITHSKNTALNELVIEKDNAASYAVSIMNESASMGHSVAMPGHETVIGSMQLSKEWVHRNLGNVSSPKNLAALSARGDTMSPTFSDGDILLVDRGVTEIEQDAVYVLALNEVVYVKRIQRRITDNAIVINSDNKFYSPVEISHDDRKRLNVLGHVVYAWNGRKL